LGGWESLLFCAFTKFFYFYFFSIFNRTVPRALHIAVEGSVGCGKSTLVRQLAWHCKDRFGVKFDTYQEPIREWVKFGQSKANLLGLMYQHPEQYSFDFQVAALLTKCEQLHDFTVKRRPNILVERTIAAQRNVFVPMLKQNNGLTDYQHEMLMRLMDYQIQMTKLNPDLYIYLRMNPEVARHRIYKRGRPEELKISLDYLQKLHVLYEKWFAEEPSENVIVVDAEQEIDLRDLFGKIWDWALQHEKFDALSYSY
jgi:deoxyadenosine/deoxycytidine kinase